MTSLVEATIEETDSLDVLESFRALAVHPKFTDELAAAIREEGGADRAVGALLSAFGLADRNPFEISVEETLDRLRKANGEQGWGIAEDAIAALAASAPEWPEGRLAFRSLRIRWGEGDEGVALTFERHAVRIRSTFEPKFWRWERLYSDKEHLRLLASNASHRPVVEWVAFDLGENRRCVRVAAVRGPKSLADEGLTFCWLFPEYVRTIDYRENPAFYLGGYELNVPGHDGGRWQDVVIVGRDLDDGTTNLDANWHGYANSGYSVPPARE